MLIGDEDDDTCEKVQHILMYGMVDIYAMELVNDHRLYCSACEEFGEKIRTARKTLDAFGFLNFIEICESNAKRMKRSNGIKKRTFYNDDECDSSCIHSGEKHTTTKKSAPALLPAKTLISTNIKKVYSMVESCCCGTTIKRDYWADPNASDIPFPLSSEHKTPFGKICYGASNRRNTKSNIMMDKMEITKVEKSKEQEASI